MIDGYPEEHELETIRNWPVKSHTDAMELINYIRERWAYANCGYFKIAKDGYEVQMSTAGWSGNESIIKVLRETLFWGLYWQQSRRGGHYTFFIPEAEK